MITMITLEE